MANSDEDTSTAGTIGVLLVDDEEPARRILREHLAAHPDIRILGECANGFDAVKAVAEMKPDLLFLDIQMPKLDGFEVLDLIGREIAVIFVTAYDEFALRAFEVHAVDYLLKPFSPERFAEALAQARRRIGAGDASGLERSGSRIPPAPQAAGARPRARRSARACARRDDHRLCRSAGRLRVLQVRRQRVSQATGDERAGGAARSRPLHPHSPVVPAEHRSPGASRALRQGQPVGDIDGRGQTPRQPHRLYPPQAAPQSDLHPRVGPGRHNCLKTRVYPVGPPFEARMAGSSLARPSVGVQRLLLEMEKQPRTDRTSGDVKGSQSADSRDELGKRAVGSTEAARGTTEAWN